MFSNNSFVPQGGSRFWPFVFKPDPAPPVPRWKPSQLLWQGILRALLKKQPVKPGALDFWSNAPRDWLATFMRSEGAGREHPSRAFIARQIWKNESVLDAGCGAGESYPVLAAADRATDYVGVDSSDPAIDIARTFYPAVNFRVGSITTLVSMFGERSFDVVLVRHVLEHQPDFEHPMQQVITVSRRLAIFVFYLTPRALPFGVRAIDPRSDLPYHVNIYSQSAIEEFLSQANLYWQWHYQIGVSRSGWLTGETNSVLLVSDRPLEIQGA